MNIQSVRRSEGSLCWNAGKCQGSYISKSLSGKHKGVQWRMETGLYRRVKMDTVIYTVIVQPLERRADKPEKSFAIIKPRVSLCYCCVFPFGTWGITHNYLLCQQIVSGHIICLLEDDRSLMVSWGCINRKEDGMLPIYNSKVFPEAVSVAGYQGWDEAESHLLEIDEIG